MENSARFPNFPPRSAIMLRTLRLTNFPPRGAAVDLAVYLTLATVEENTATASDCGESV